MFGYATVSVRIRSHKIHNLPSPLEAQGIGCSAAKLTLYVHMSFRPWGSGRNVRILLRAADATASSMISRFLYYSYFSGKHGDDTVLVASIKLRYG